MTIALEYAIDRADRRRRIWAIFGSSSGNLVEWYDFYAYAFTALYFAHSFFSRRQSNHATSTDRRGVRDRLFDAADWRLHFRLHCRQVRPQKFYDDLRADDVRRISCHRGVADLCNHWSRGTRPAASRPNAAGSVGGRRIRYQRDLYER